MGIRLEGVTVLADDVAALADFYERALGWEVAVREDAYVAFGGQGIRFAIFSRALMAGSTDGVSTQASSPIPKEHPFPVR